MMRLRSQAPPLPLEVYGLIIEHLLSLPPLYPNPQPGDLPTPAWSDGGYQDGASRVRRIKLRRGVARHALVLMRVCKGWKNLAEPFFWAEPHVHSRNLVAFTAALHRREPAVDTVDGGRARAGRSGPREWVRTLHGGDTHGCHHRSAHPLLICAECTKGWAALAALLPNLEHMALPSFAISPAKLAHLPCIGKLRSAQNVAAHGHPSWYASLATFLSSAPSLELLAMMHLSINVVSSNRRGYRPSEDANLAPLTVPNLHTLFISGMPDAVHDPLPMHWRFPSVRRLGTMHCATEDGAPMLSRLRDQVLSVVLDDCTQDLKWAAPEVQHADGCLHIHHASGGPGTSPKPALLLARDRRDALAALVDFARAPVRTFGIALGSFHCDSTTRSIEADVFFKPLLQMVTEEPDPGPLEIVITDFEWAQTSRKTNAQVLLAKWATKMHTVGIDVKDGHRELAPGLTPSW